MKKVNFTSEFLEDLNNVVEELGLVDFTPDGAPEGTIELADPVTSTEDLTSLYVLRTNGAVSRASVGDDVMLEAVYLNMKDPDGNIINAYAYEQLGLVVAAVIKHRK